MTDTLDADDMTVRERLAVPVLMKLDDLTPEAAIHCLQSTEHSGDCTKDAWTCARCRADVALSVVGDQIAALKKPTEGMVWKMREFLSPEDGEQDVRLALRAMIQHIQEGGK